MRKYICCIIFVFCSQFSYSQDIFDYLPFGLDSLARELIHKTGADSIADVWLEEFGLLGSSVNRDIPTNDKIENRHVLIIGNETYENPTPKVDFANIDARIFSQYAELTLGVPEQNIEFLKDATAGKMKAAIEKFINKMETSVRLGDSAEFIFYYAGHGHPSKDSIPYLIPTDVNSKNIITHAINLHNFYKKIGDVNPYRATIFLDACFTGEYETSRSLWIKPRLETLYGNIIVFSASDLGKKAWPYPEEKHGIFTYFLLKKLQESAGDITYNELAEYLINKVDYQSVEIHTQHQIPLINTSESIVNEWREWKIYK